MKYTKCPICDERLRNGICPVCGYDFKRLEKKADLGGRHWDVLKRDTRTKKPSFVHDEKKCGRSKKSQTKKVSSWKNNGRTRNRNRAMSKQKANKIFMILVVIMLLFGFLSIFGSVIVEEISDIKYQIQTKILGEDETDPVMEHDPYQYTTYDLDTDGEYFETELKAGEYIVGVDLPEGIYQASIQEGKTALMVKNQEQNINFYDFYKADAQEDDSFYKTAEEVRLYEGTYLKIDCAGTMKFETDCARRNSKLLCEDNPQNETIRLKGTMTAGKDFHAGSYDMVCKKNRGTVQTKYKRSEDGIEYTTDYSLIAGGSNDVWGDPEKYNQVYFYEGMKVTVPKDMEVELVPSQYTISEHALQYRFYE